MDHNFNNRRVLLTGISGFLGSHTAIQLLNKGYKVTGTVRNLSRANDLKAIIEKHTPHIQNLTIAEADLNDESKWPELTQNIDFIQHIASPFPRILPKHESDLIIPARNGVLNILKSASVNNVKRVVITSSIAAVVYGKNKKDLDLTFTEKDWTDESNKKDSTPYFRSKTIAEKAAWEYLKKNPSGLELVTVLPGAILGPVLEDDFGTSANIVIKTIDGSMPAIPKIGVEIIDVRSVADLLIKAMELPQANNQRYLASSGYLSFKNISGILKKEYPNRKVPSKELPDFFVKLLSNFETSLKPILIDLGIERKIDRFKAVNELNWQPLSMEEAILSCAESVIALKIVK
ncbi:SDR family oxidoreductase [Flavobacterium hydrophilum]|uniref:Nucleoside-diphosphate sugar epimerase n=1 Tax=Flavobacterium hydrophilum TaxID=2211445 RepID=A0A2V4C9S9_9FLAO|nr:aldehyde reductase [Flavobacterium hydrophilum]PXY47322.1 nucleoside-diphosphate sugar epimerase [Flavobacterium hydrophilum]